MPLDFGRYNVAGEVTVDHIKCTVCGLCVSVCKGFPLFIENNKLQIDHTRGFGCIGCGQCVCICPNDAISVKGRDLYPENVVPIPEDQAQAEYSALYSLMLSRRSIRNYKTQDVDPDLIKKIIAGAATAPMGVPPTEISVLVLPTKAKMDIFYHELLSEANNLRKMLNPFMLGLMKLGMKPADRKMFDNFVIPVLDLYAQKEALGENWFTYDAPCGLYFYPSAYADMPDVTLAATHAMLVAESLGLGSIMLGFVGVIVSKSKNIKNKYGLTDAEKPGIFLALGHPKVQYRKSIIKKMAKEIWS